MAEAAPRSTFVTVVAWVFIVLSGLALAAGALQGAVFGAMFQDPLMREGFAKMPAGMPPVVVWMLEHVQVLVLGSVLVSAAKLACSIGLLRRRNWARLGFVALLGLAIACNLAGLVLQFEVIDVVREELRAEAAGGGPDLQGVVTVMMVMATVFALAYVALYAWIAKRLLSPAIAAEFRPRAG